MANGNRDYITRMFLSELFKTDTSSPMTPVSQYESVFDRKWLNLDKEDVEELTNLKTTTTNLYNHMIKGKSKDKTIPIEDSYQAHIAKIEKQIKLVNDYEHFTKAYTIVNPDTGEKTKHLGKIGGIYRDLEKSLVNNQMTLDQLNEVVFNGSPPYDNWEALLASGSEDQIDLFNEKVKPYMDKNGENIASILMRITDAENEFSKYTGFSSAGYTSRDIELLRHMATGLGEELNTTTFLTDKEAGAIQEMWTTKNIKPYINLKNSQEKESRDIVSLLKSERNSLAIELEKLELVYNQLDRSGKDDAFSVALNMSQDEIGIMIAEAKAGIKSKNIDIMKTGELGSSLGIGGSFDIDPLTEEVRKAKKAGELGLPIQEPPDDDPNKDKTWDSSIHGADSTPEQRMQNRLEKYGMKKREYYEMLELYKEGDDAGKAFDFSFDKFLEDSKGEGVEQEAVEEEVVDLDAMINEYTNIFKGTGFSRTDEGKAFADKHGLNPNGNVMKGLQRIANAKRNDPKNELPNTQASIDKIKAKMTGSLEDVRAENIGIKIKKATSLVEKYVHGNKLSEEEMKNIKNVIPNIDEIISKYKEEKKIASKYGSGLSFKTWLEDNKDIYSIDYNKLAGTL